MKKLLFLSVIIFITLSSKVSASDYFYYNRDNQTSWKYNNQFIKKFNSSNINTKNNLVIVIEDKQESYEDNYYLNSSSSSYYYPDNYQKYHLPPNPYNYKY